MNRALLEEVAAKAGVSEAAAQAVLDVLGDMVREGRLSRATVVLDGFGKSPHPEVDPADGALVDELIARARAHPLGLGYLEKGLLASVAATFHAHAFTVLAARERLTKQEDRNRP